MKTVDPVVSPVGSIDVDWNGTTLSCEKSHCSLKATRQKLSGVYENELGALEVEPSEERPGYYLSMAWSGSFAGCGQAIGTWLDVAVAEDTRAAMDIVRECTQPTLTWIFADRDGHIGQQCCGRFPRRGGGHTGLTPIPAWDAQNHWQGWLSSDCLPSIYDPPRGFVATANEEQNPATGPLLVTQTVHDYRVRRICERLHELPAANLQDMQDLQYDVTSLQARELIQLFLPYLPEGELRERLASWDCRYSPDSHQATLFQRLYRNVIVEIFGHEEGIGWRRMVYLCSRAGFSVMVLSAMDRVLQKETSHWWKKRDKGEMIRRAAERTLTESDETWAEVNNFHFADRYFGAIKVGRLAGFKSRQYPMPGNFATPFQGHVLQTATRESTFSPSYHFVTDMGSDDAWTNLPGGPRESRFSRYYNIDVPNWLAGEYKRLRADASAEEDAADDDSETEA